MRLYVFAFHYLVTLSMNLSHWFQKDLALTRRMRAVAEVILEFGPVIEKAVLDGREYMSIKELQIATKAVDAADKLGEVMGSIINYHLKTRAYDIYDVLDEPLRGKIRAFSEDAQIYIVNEHVESVVCDYFLTNLDELLTLSDDEFVNDMDRSSRTQIIHCLWDFDQAMHELQVFAKMEPVVYENLTPFEERMAKIERKIFGKDYQRISEEFRHVDILLEEHPILEISPSDLQRVGKAIEEYLADWDEDEREFWRDYYEDEL